MIRHRATTPPTPGTTPGRRPGREPGDHPSHRRPEHRRPDAGHPHHPPGHGRRRRSSRHRRPPVAPRDGPAGGGRPRHPHRTCLAHAQPLDRSQWKHPPPPTSTSIVAGSPPAGIIAGRGAADEPGVSPTSRSWPPRWSTSSPRCPRGWWSTPPSEGPGTPPPILEANPGSRLLGIDRDPAAVEAATAALARFGDRAVVRQVPLRRPRAGGPAGPGRVRDRPASAGPVRRALRPRRQLAPARRGRAGLLLPARRPPRHADGPDRRAAPPPTWSTSSTRTTWWRCSPRTARAASPAASPGPSWPPGPSPPPASWPTWSGPPSPPPPAAPAATRPVGCSRPSASPSTRSSTSSTGPSDDALALLQPGGRCVVISYHSGEDRLVKSHLRPGGHRTGAPALPACPASAGPSPTTDWWPGVPGVRRPTRSTGTAARRRPACGSSSASGSAQSATVDQRREVA